MDEVNYIEAIGRGVKSDTITREIVDTIATAALRDGNVAISYMSYGDDPVRVGIPMKAFAAVSSTWESIEGEVARYNPDRVNVSFILDATLAKGLENWANMGRRSVLEKIKQGALVIVNTTMTPEEYLDYLPKTDLDYTLVTIDGGDIEKPSVLPLLGAFVAESSIVSEQALRDTLGVKYRNLDKLVESVALLKKMQVSKGTGGMPAFGLPPRLPTASEMPIAVVVPAVPVKGRNPNFKTGASRTYKPSVDPEICIKCKTCWILCPDGVIDMRGDEHASIDYDYCTGCGICENNCPMGAISSQLELKEEIVI
jgi:2-oxoacid:acceptor oxidoreductase delta subunit (pyruvate/2-ketoisovalerate family)